MKAHVRQLRRDKEKIAQFDRSIKSLSLLSFFTSVYILEERKRLRDKMCVLHDAYCRGFVCWCCVVGSVKLIIPFIFCFVYYFEGLLIICSRFTYQHILLSLYKYKRMKTHTNDPKLEQQLGKGERERTNSYIQSTRENSHTRIRYGYLPSEETSVDENFWNQCWSEEREKENKKKVW